MRFVDDCGALIVFRCAIKVKVRILVRLVGRLVGPVARAEDHKSQQLTLIMPDVLIHRQPQRSHSVHVTGRNLTTILVGRKTQFEILCDYKRGPLQSGKSPLTLWIQQVWYSSTCVYILRYAVILGLPDEGPVATERKA